MRKERKLCGWGGGGTFGSSMMSGGDADSIRVTVCLGEAEGVMEGDRPMSFGQTIPCSAPSDRVGSPLMMA